MQREFAGLDLLRFICAVAIVLYHYQHFFYDQGVNTCVGATPWDAPFFGVLMTPYRYGLWSVPLFWCISGFIFFYRYADMIFERRISLRDFWILRITRLYPLHWVTLMVVALLQWLFSLGHTGAFVYRENDLFHAMLNLVMIQHWGLQSGFSFNGPSWSVSVEEFVYLVFFFVGSGARLLRPGSVLVLSVGSLMLLFSSFMIEEFRACLAMFFMGGVLYFLHRELVIRRRWFGRHSWIINFAIGAVAWATTFVAMLQLQGWILLPTTVVTWGATLPGQSFVQVMITVAFLSLDLRGRLASVAATLGGYTYASYMVHFPVQLSLVILTDMVFESRCIYRDWLLLAAFVGTTMAASLLARQFIEVPAQRRLRRWLLPSVTSV